jgi:tetratricopeptide (TPR) repeat protein
MGEKQGRRGKHFYLFFACIIIIPILFSGCAHFYEELIAGPDFDEADDFTRQGNYNAAVSQYERIIDHYPLTGDRALFQTGIIYASPLNKHKDYYKAQEFFQRLVNKYPQSRYRSDSDVLISLINEIAGKDKRAITQHKRIDKLEQQVEEIEKKFERMKKIDMNWKRKKKNSP